MKKRNRRPSHNHKLILSYLRSNDGFSLERELHSFVKEHGSNIANFSRWIKYLERKGLISVVWKNRWQHAYVLND